MTTGNFIITKHLTVPTKKNTFLQYVYHMYGIAKYQV